MTRRYLGATIIAMLIAQVVPAADNAEQQELLAWARTLRYQARVEQALAVCEMIVASDPGCAGAWTERGVLLLADSRPDEAREAFGEALKHDAANATALAGRGHAHSAQEDFERSRRDASNALEHCNRAIAAENADAETYYARGLAKMLLEDPTALQDFVMAVSLDPGHMDAHTERAQICLARGRSYDAIDQLTRAVDIRPDFAVGFLERARVHYLAGNVLLAIDDCDRALQVNPQYARAWHNRGLLSIESGDFEAAIRDLTEAISAAPEYAAAHVYRGQAYVATGDESAARADWERTRELDPSGWAGQAARDMLRKLDAR
ncbi:MAG: tetratricopeptide repeat protein [Armatimonadota bacterium]|jgi:tetratricopeptide (TPR) repeat protein